MLLCRAPLAPIHTHTAAQQWCAQPPRLKTMMEVLAQLEMEVLTQQCHPPPPPPPPRLSGCHCWRQVQPPLQRHPSHSKAQQAAAAAASEVAAVQHSGACCCGCLHCRRRRRCRRRRHRSPHPRIAQPPTPKGEVAAVPACLGLQIQPVHLLCRWHHLQGQLDWGLVGATLAAALHREHRGHRQVGCGQGTLGAQEAVVTPRLSPVVTPRQRCLRPAARA